ncbi:energy-coupling factor ABC transporter ATP-binding protein [Gemmatimonadota bacterium]
MSERETSAVSIRDLGFSYEKGRDVLSGINLDIRRGERFGIIGPSGAGKSTLLLHLNGILRGQSGSVEIGNIAVKDETLSSIRQKVGLVFQNPDDQLFNPTVEEDVAFGPLNMGLRGEDSAMRVREALRDMNLEGFEKHSPHHLSYGERKRVALATVLSMRPEIVAFDEPFSNLNPAMVEQLIGIVKGLDATVIIVSQSIIPVLAACERVAVLNEGAIAAVGPVSEIAAERELLRECGLDFHFYCEICRGLSEMNGANDV